MRIRIRDLFDPGSGMEKFGSGIEYKHPESTTLPRTVATLALAVRSHPPSQLDLIHDAFSASVVSA
jgi:hypothetical protein